MKVILKYFPHLSPEQIKQFELLEPLYAEWNKKINVISRKDIQHFYQRHVLHSLAIGKVISFRDHTTVLDVGTGGGFPSIPLAVLFPSVQFHLIDSIGKKIHVVKDVVSKAGLKNVTAEQIRAEKVMRTFDFIVSRSVTSLPEFVNLVKNKNNVLNKNTIKNGIFYLKGGNIESETARIEKEVKIFLISSYFAEDYFHSKKIVYIPFD